MLNLLDGGIVLETYDAIVDETKSTNITYEIVDETDSANITYDKNKKLYTVSILLPGYDKEKIKVFYNKKFEFVRIHSSLSEQNNKDIVNIAKNFSIAKEKLFSIHLRNNSNVIDDENITSEYNNGILNIYLPVKEGKKEEQMIIIK